MEAKKYLKGYWSKSFLIIGVVFILVACRHVDKRYEKQLSEVNNHEPYKVINVKFQDTIYRVIVREKGVDLQKQYPDNFPQILKDSGILNIDSATFALLRGDIVTPQHRIDSIYKGNIDILLSYGFNDNGMLTLPISYEEEKYLIDIFFRNKILLNIDCESGFLFIDQ